MMIAAPPPPAAPSPAAVRIPRTVCARTILVAEDEASVALEIEFALMEAGAIIRGPFASLRDVVTAASGPELDGAILDVDLRGEHVFPAADVLAARGIPFLFHTGRAEPSALAERYPRAPVLRKPATADTLIAGLERLF